MKNMQQLYQNAKHCTSDKNITAYRETVEEFTTSPKEYVENIQYILPSSIGIKTLQEFVLTHGISIASYQPIIECIQACIEKCEKNKKDASLYKEALEFMESFKNKYRHNFYMFENFKEDLKPKYAEAYYKNFPVLREGKEVNFSKIIERFGESVIPDMIVYADMFGNTNNVLTPFKERYDRLDTTTKLWLEECEKDLFTEGLLDMIKNIPANIRSRSNVDQPGKENDPPSAPPPRIKSYTQNDLPSPLDIITKNIIKDLAVSMKKFILEDPEFRSIRDKMTFKNIEWAFDSGIKEFQNMTYTVSCPDQIAPGIDILNLIELSSYTDGPIEFDNPRDLDYDHDIAFMDAHGWFDENLSRQLAQKIFDILSEKYNPELNKYGMMLMNQKMIDQHQYIDVKNFLSGEYDLEILVAVCPTSEENAKQLYYSIFNESSSTLTENAIMDIVRRNERSIQEYVILGEEKEVSFAESELESIKDLISFKENLITLVESEEERMNLQNEVYDLYESIGDLLDEDVADSVIPMLPGANQNIEIRSINEDWLNNTHNKKTGTTPDYLKNAHDLSWGEDDNTPPKKRPSASDDDKPDDDDDLPSDDKKEKDPLDKIEPFDYDANKSDSSDDKNSGSSKSSQGHIQNYYYYTYNNSNNTHSTTNTNSYNRSQDDHSRNKRTKSHDYGGAKEEKQLWEVELSGIDSYQEGLFGNLFSSSSREILGETSDMKISDIDDGELWKLTSKIKRELCIQIKKLIHEDRRFEYIMNGGAEGAVEQLDRRINDNYLGYDDLLVIQKIQEENTIKYIAYGDMISDIDDQFDEVPVWDKQLIQTAYESLANLPIMEEIETLTEKYGFDLLGPNDIGSDIKKIMRCIPCVGIFSSDSETLSKWWNEYNLRYGESVMYEDSIDDSKPSSDNPIQDTMLDLDRKLSGIQQSVKSKVQGVQRTASAIAKPFKRTSQWITNMVSRWKDANENDLKAKMADPHERSTLLSAFKSAIKYGSLMKAGLLLNPIIMFLTISKKWSDRKNSFRIRNEMIGELKAELEIIEEKIRDADQAQERSAKYKLMRFRNELKKKLIRVGGTPEMKNMI
nr:MAG TPA: hypothetical protein [Caudoviricetes sp.]